MSDLLRMMNLHMSHNGTCRKCGIPRDKGNHRKCDKFSSGFTYHANSKETTLAELRKIVEIICQDDRENTPIQFTLHIRQVKD